MESMLSLSALNVNTGCVTFILYEGVEYEVVEELEDLVKEDEEGANSVSAE